MKKARDQHAGRRTRLGRDQEEEERARAPRERLSSLQTCDRPSWTNMRSWKGNCRSSTRLSGAVPEFDYLQAELQTYHAADKAEVDEHDRNLKRMQKRLRRRNCVFARRAGPSEAKLKKMMDDQPLPTQASPTVAGRATWTRGGHRERRDRPHPCPWRRRRAVTSRVDDDDSGDRCRRPTVVAFPGSPHHLLPLLVSALSLQIPVRLMIVPAHATDGEHPVEADDSESQHHTDTTHVISPDWQHPTRPRLGRAACQLFAPRQLSDHPQLCSPHRSSSAHARRQLESRPRAARRGELKRAAARR